MPGISCWDNDGAFMRAEYAKRQFSDQESWESGVSNYWGNVLFQRCLQSETFREDLDAAIQDLRNSFTEERLQTMVDGYTGGGKALSLFNAGSDE